MPSLAATFPAAFSTHRFNRSFSGKHVGRLTTCLNWIVNAVMPYQRPNILSSILFELFEPSIAEAKSVWSVAELVNSRRADLSGRSLSSGLDSRLSNPKPTRWFTLENRAWFCWWLLPPQRSAFRRLFEVFARHWFIYMEGDCTHTTMTCLFQQILHTQKSSTF